jgi:hypothetical protein
MGTFDVPHATRCTETQGRTAGASAPQVVAPVVSQTGPFLAVVLSQRTICKPLLPASAPVHAIPIPPSRRFPTRSAGLLDYLESRAIIDLRPDRRGSPHHARPPAWTPHTAPPSRTNLRARQRPDNQDAQMGGLQL